MVEPVRILVSAMVAIGSPDIDRPWPHTRYCTYNNQCAAPCMSLAIRQTVGFCVIETNINKLQKSCHGTKINPVGGYYTRWNTENRDYPYLYITFGFMRCTLILHTTETGPWYCRVFTTQSRRCILHQPMHECRYKQQPLPCDIVARGDVYMHAYMADVNHYTVTQSHKEMYACMHIWLM